MVTGRSSPGMWGGISVVVAGREFAVGVSDVNRCRSRAT